MNAITSLQTIEANRRAQIVYSDAERSCCKSSNTASMKQGNIKVERPDVKIIGFVHVAKRFRGRRNEFFGVALFRDPAWDMLLDLLLAEAEGKRLSVSALCLGSGVAMTTALRHIERLTRVGFVVKEGDDRDERRVFISLMPAQRDRLYAYLSAWHHALAESAPQRPIVPTSATPPSPTIKQKCRPTHPVFLP